MLAIMKRLISATLKFIREPKKEKTWGEQQ